MERDRRFGMGPMDATRCFPLSSPPFVASMPMLALLDSEQRRLRMPENFSNVIAAFCARHGMPRARAAAARSLLPPGPAPSARGGRRCYRVSIGGLHPGKLILNCSNDETPKKWHFNLLERIGHARNTHQHQQRTFPQKMQGGDDK